MKRLILTLITILSLTTISLPVSAQALKSIYFVDGVATRHQLNPAFAPQSGYVGIPFLGDIGFSVNSNLSVKKFLFPTSDGQLTTFMNGEIDNAMFLKKIRNNNFSDINLKLNLFQFGFFKWGGFNSFDINVRSQSSVNVPYDLFAFLKEGMSSPSSNFYDLGKTNIHSQNFADIVLGHSRAINSQIRVGGKAKILLGVANVKADFSSMNVYMSEDKWIIDSKGAITSSGGTFETDRQTGEVTGIDEIKPGVNGVGVAFDLGATYRPITNVELSVAVLDAGFIKWKNNAQAASQGDPFIFTGFEDIDVDKNGDGKTLEDQMDDLTDDLEALFRFYDMKTGSVRNVNALNTTLNVGAEYMLPNNKFSVGVLSSTLFSKKHVITDLMVSANYTPAKWFTFTAHASGSNVGWTWGGLLNFSPRRFNFFLGATVVSSKFTPQAFPVNNLTANISLGMSVYLARNKDRN